MPAPLARQLRALLTDAQVLIPLAVFALGLLLLITLH